MTVKAKVYLACVYLIGLATLTVTMSQWHWVDFSRFACYLLIAMLASGLKVSLPGINGSMSVNFFFIILGVMELSVPETIVIGCASSMVQSFWRSNSRPKLVQLTFNIANMATAIYAAGLAYRYTEIYTGHTIALMLVAAACTYFVANTVPVAIVIALTEKKSFQKIWSECYFWSFPYYLVGAAISGFVSYINGFVGWQASLLVFPVIYWVYRSYRLYLGRLEDEKRHVENMAALHLRTIEALALAIEAKDHTTHDHLQRVRIYAIEVGKELNLTEEQIEALRAASLLHDIGKLAVPEHIINKPGKLTPEEFEKMKIHPIVGAEILERVNFPNPVVPIVRAHHEKYDGSGYPFGLKGEEIPIGARILACVDCLDALASDRQYRRALPLHEAMEEVTRQAGKSFDPRVVEVLRRRYVELEQLAQQKAQLLVKRKLSTDLKITQGAAPAAGFAQLPAAGLESPSGSFLSSIAAARQEAQTLFELSHELGNSLSLDETLSVLSVRLRKLVPFDSIAIYVLRESRLVPEYVSGDNFRLFSSLEIPLGQGLSGWVAANRKPIVNGNPSVEPGYLSDPSKLSTLRSAISVPLEGVSNVLGALTLYKAEADSFTQDHLRVLLAISSKVALSIENALKYQQAENSATTDYLTALPNARSLFLHLDQELSRCKRTDSSLAVMVCDLDGFKAVNDRFGHLEGNKVLRVFANSLRNVCREYDYVARMGGDEFIIIAPGLTRDAAEEKAALLNDLALDAGREVCGEDLLSISVGTAFFSEDGMDAEQLLAEADRRMYIVKQIHHEKMGIAETSAGTGVDIAVN
ncbi:MAG TPA: HD domain-containing phosphohydrolase [Terriglobales bacterium]|nr:HD domain-containing phosphohydrolase [Terriglobales bacterium]